MLAAMRAALPAGDAFFRGVNVRMRLLPYFLEDLLQHLAVPAHVFFAPFAGFSLAGFSLHLFYAG